MIARTDAGVCVFANLPRGEYLVTATQRGFATTQEKVNIPDRGSVSRTIVLRVPAAITTITVESGPSPTAPAAGNETSVDARSLTRAADPQSSRGIVDLVQVQPGWLLEANGVLHPRGAEYNTQYIIDGLPVYSNQSPGYAPTSQADEVESVTIRTGGYPAEIGRKLGGVVELRSNEETLAGLHGFVESGGGSFAQRRGATQLGYRHNGTLIELTGEAGASDRFMDPPAIANYSNTGHTAKLHFGLAQFGPRDTLRLTFEDGRSGFQIPNETVQEKAGQRQSRTLEELRGGLSFSHQATKDLVFHVRGAFSSGDALLNSNQYSTPIQPWQYRTRRTFHALTSVSEHHGHHELSAGADVMTTSLAESFRYHITDVTAFDPGTPPDFSFRDHALAVESSWFAQDGLSLGPVVANVGIRWDYYNLLVHDSAWSPRMAVAWRIPKIGMVLRGSYDRVFDTPAKENLLLASSPDPRNVQQGGVGTAVHPELGTFVEVGAKQKIGTRGSISFSAFRRTLENFSDDDVFLNTGVNFPVSFRRAIIEGMESQLTLKLSDQFMIQTSWSNLSGMSQLPISGGLFLGNASELASNEWFRITQDQRNTLTSQAWYQPVKRLWFGVATWYGSGLPIEVDDTSLTSTADPQILKQIDLQRGRVRPSYALQVSTGVSVWNRGTQGLEAQFSVSNVTNRVNVIDFAGFFSGTALAPPRAFDGHLRYRF